MAKKKGKGKAITVKKAVKIFDVDDFDELAEHVTDKHKNRRHLVLINEPHAHVAKIPQAVIFADGKRIVLNAD